jgi:3-deoxy-D-manno-octulosonic-acid transferase
MIVFWALLYNLILFPLLFIFGIIGTFFNQKLKDGFKGRMLSIPTLRSYFKDFDRSYDVYWFHVASHGEFQQVLPVLAGLKEVEPKCTVLVSFFSPSGYHHVKNEQIDCKIYLPFDFIWSIWRALKIVQPKKIIFAGYDVWPNLVWIASLQTIHITIFAAFFREKTHKYYPVIRNFYRSVYHSFSSIYTISGSDYLSLQKIVSINKSPLIRVLGNPRYDQVKNHADTFTQERTMSVLQREKRIVAGSVWPEDEAIIIQPIIQLLKKYEKISLLWIPHEPTDQNIQAAIKEFEKQGLTVKRHNSKINLDIRGAQVVVVGVVGILSKLYWQGQIAYVGGGFSSGVHNVMEPAIARLPVLFGPKHDNSHEAGELIQAGGGFSVESSIDVTTTLSALLNDQDYYLNASYAATDVIHQNLGSSTRVVRGIIRD